MYIGTNRPAVRGDRVRVEVVDSERGFMVEGVVTHARKMPPELQHVKPSGMGIRFLHHDELLSSFSPAPLTASTIDSGAPRPQAGASWPAAGARRASSPATASTAATGSSTPDFSSPSAGDPSPPPTGGVVRPPLQGLNLAPDGVVPIHFRSREALARVFDRDMRHGGLFIPTRRPAQLDQVVSLQIHLPGAGEDVVIPARVVHLQADEGGDAPPPGMGVQFLDPEAVVERIRRLMEEPAAS